MFSRGGVIAAPSEIFGTITLLTVVVPGLDGPPVRKGYHMPCSILLFSMICDADGCRSYFCVDRGPPPGRCFSLFFLYGLEGVYRPRGGGGYLRYPGDEPDLGWFSVLGWVSKGRVGAYVKYG